METRTAIRLKALHAFGQIIATNKTLHEDELLELMLSTFSGVYADHDTSVRCQAVKMLVEQAKSCASRKCEDIIALIQKVSLSTLEDIIGLICRRLVLLPL